MPVDWLDDYKAKGIKPPIVCDYGLTRGYVVMSKDGSKEIFPQPSEPAEQIRKWTWERYKTESKAFWDSDRHLTANIFERAVIYKHAVGDLALKAEHLFGLLIRIAEMEDAKTNTYALHNLVWNFNKFIARDQSACPDEAETGPAYQPKICQMAIA